MLLTPPENLVYNTTITQRQPDPSPGVSGHQSNRLRVCQECYCEPQVTFDSGLEPWSTTVRPSGMMARPPNLTLKVKDHVIILKGRTVVPKGLNRLEHS